MRKFCFKCKKIKRHKFKYIGTEDSHKSDEGADEKFIGCLLIIISGGLWLILEWLTPDYVRKLYDRSCSECGHTEHGVPKR